MQLRKALPHHNSNGRHRSGGILALLTSSLLLAAGAAVGRPDCADWNTWDFFYQATAADVGRCLSQGADLEARSEYGVTPLHSAVMQANSSTLMKEETLEELIEAKSVKALLDAGADPEARADGGVTPLHLAMPPIFMGTRAMSLLLAAGADPNARDNQESTPLHMAAAHYQNDGWPHLPESDIDIAALKDQFLAHKVKELLAAGADLEARDEDGRPPCTRRRGTARVQLW
ncbi:MAG: hypothetical protein F4Y87_01095 [Synechococcus sp. SB0665_bin_28]|nr:hypothetical protein [Synechococcus sp. SB0665_bin_28]